MSIVVSEVLLHAALFAGLLLAGALGRLVHKRQSQRAAESQPGVRATENAVLGLLGLLLAFTFSGAADRFEGRKHLAIEEANAIGTAYLRLDILAEGDREAVQALMRRYVDSRIKSYRVPNADAATAEIARTQNLQQEIWTYAADAARRQPAPVAEVLWPALNAVFDVAASRIAQARIHPPFVITATLIGVAFLSAALVGYAMATARGSLPHLLIFAAVISFTISMILDLEYPRHGLIRVDDIDELLVNVRRSLDPAAGASPHRGR